MFPLCLTSHLMCVQSFYMVNINVPAGVCATPLDTTSCIMKPNLGPQSSHSCDCSDALLVPQHQTSEVCTHPFIALPLQHDICVLQATTEQYENLAMRLQVSLLCSMIQVSPLLCWPQRSTDEVAMQVDSVPPGS